jgi:hypothetical protein
VPSRRLHSRNQSRVREQERSGAVDYLLLTDSLVGSMGTGSGFNENQLGGRVAPQTAC